VVFTRQLQGHSGAVCDLATNEQKQLASCDENGMIIVWVDPTLSADSDHNECGLGFNNYGNVPTCQIAIDSKQYKTILLLFQFIAMTQKTAP